VVRSQRRLRAAFLLRFTLRLVLLLSLYQIGLGDRENVPQSAFKLAVLLRWRRVGVEFRLHAPIIAPRKDKTNMSNEEIATLRRILAETLRAVSSCHKEIRLLQLQTMAWQHTMASFGDDPQMRQLFDQFQAQKNSLEQTQSLRNPSELDNLIAALIAEAEKG
jgi:hypothetical protein